VEAALGWQARFDANPAAIKSEALAARAVPEWLAAEMDAIPTPGCGACNAIRPCGSAPGASSPDRSPAPSAIAGRRKYPCGRIQSPGDGPAATAFRYAGPRDLFLTDEFQHGQFEIQDLASQLVGHACNPQPGETWWDACAGEGGKTLHLADLMRNKGSSGPATARFAGCRS